MVGVGYPTSIEERDVAERSLTHHVRVGREYPVEPKLCQNQDESSPFFFLSFWSHMDCSDDVRFLFLDSRIPTSGRGVWYDGKGPLI